MPFLVLLLVLVGVPTALLVSYAFRESTFAGVGPGPTLDQFRDLFESDTVVRLALRTAVVAFTVAFVATTGALVVAYAATFRFSRRASLAILAVALAAGLASFLVRVYAWGTILGRNGLINNTLERVGLVEQPLDFIFFGYFSVIVTMTYVYLPIGILMVYSAMQGVDRHSVEASRDLGMGRWRTMLGVVVPQVRAGLLASLALITVLASADYVTPRIVGGIKGQMLGSLIRDRAIGAADLPGAAAVAVAFVAFLLATAVLGGVVWLLLRLAVRSWSPALHHLATRLAAHAPARLSRVSLSRPVTLALVAFLIMPTVVVVVFSFNRSTTLGFPWRGFTGTWYRDVLDRPGLAEALATSVRLLAVVLAGAMLLGIPYAFALHHARGAWRRVLGALVVLPLVVPGALLGLGLLTFADSRRIPLGFALTAAAHIVLVTPVIVMVVYTQLTTRNPQLLEAARVMGSSPLRAFRTVSLPLLLPSLVGATLVAAAISLDEVFVTTFTIGAESTLPIWLFGQARVGFNPGLNALGVMVVGVTLLALAAAALALRRAQARSAPTVRASAET